VTKNKAVYSQSGYALVSAGGRGRGRDRERERERERER